MICRRNSTAMSLASDQRHLPKINSLDPLENRTGGEAHLFDDQRQRRPEVFPRLTADLLPDGISTPHIEPYSADALTAMTSASLALKVIQ
jgi:hypothetical protein